MQGGPMRSRGRRREDGHDGSGRKGEAGQVRGEESGEAPPPLAVLLFPSELMFQPTPRSAQRRVLTLYNPNTFSLRYKVSCTTPSLYRVPEAEGRVPTKSCIDLVVRHLDVSPANYGRRDRFRVEVRGGGQVGGREIWAELRGGAEEEKEEKRRRTGGGGVEGEGRRGRAGQQRVSPPPPSPLSPLLVPTHTHRPTCTAVCSVSQWVVCVSAAVLCVTVLMLPLHTDTSSMVPPCLHVSTNQKLACAYMLGLLTVVFLR